MLGFFILYSDNQKFDVKVSGIKKTNYTISRGKANTLNYVLVWHKSYNQMICKNCWNSWFTKDIWDIYWITTNELCKVLANENIINY